MLVFSPILVAQIDFGHFFCPFLTLGFSIWKKSEKLDSLSYSGIYIIFKLKNCNSNAIKYMCYLILYHPARHYFNLLTQIVINNSLDLSVISL